ncbi:serine carboxypeptidase-like 40 isoform X2 [Salvia splendens]|uniref:serine carboxypeptidase-like 40 isoform X2 n=1 Tax=Salvia splendens TaxID=180675 RepID=UPI001C26DBB4|nr:serine carboxypeptidase-like 40 isoform X2 [Salvia splendens]
MAYKKLVFFVYLSFLISHINGKTQTQRLSSIYKYGKMKNRIGRSHYNNFEEAQVYSQEGLKENDLIKGLPGQPPVRFKQYGGYVTVNQTAGRAFYYYLAEAQISANSSPLLLWLNGGPGCSSLGYGAMQELGPFRVHSDGKTLYINPFSWNQGANVVFLESPAGVGFSYSNTSSDVKNNGDRRTAIDNYNFLVNWFNRFPEYKDRDFYIAGESYAGHYAPQLAQTILYHNRYPYNTTTIINLKGIIIGNGFMSWETDVKGMYEFLGSHAIVSDEITDRIMKYCYSSSSNSIQQQDECREAVEEANSLANALRTPSYNIYAPTCFNHSLTQNPNRPSVLHMDPCTDDYVEAYLNRPQVQKALHANLTNIPYAWQLCSNDVPFNWQDMPWTVLPLLKELMANGLRIWLYSGDVDGNVPVTSTKNTIKDMKLPIKSSWRAWYVGGEVGGYTQVYEGELTFATIRGAGHEVPSYQPARALSLISSFLAGIQLPYSSTD